MQEIFLNIDGKGIIPQDIESKGDYVTRGTNLISLMLKPRLKEKLFSKVETCFSYYSIKEIKISEKIYNFLEKKYECDLRWVPCFKRSEEHTSELQSHSFISYAVFCLKNKSNLHFSHFIYFIFLI